MALTDDQKAMLRLLAQREEGYEDMAALMGISVGEVRERVKEALAEVDEAGSKAEEEATATPAPPPPSPSPAAPEPPDKAAAGPVDAKGNETAQPKAEEEPVPSGADPQPPSPPPASPASAKPRASRRPTLKRPSAPRGLPLPKDRGALIGLGAGAVVLVALAIVLVVSGGGGSSSSSTTTSGSTTASEGTNAAATGDSNLTEAILSPTNGGDASGRALFGRYKKNVLLQVEAEGLDPAPAGQSYNVWLYRSPKVALRVGTVPVAKTGKIAAQLPIPAQLLAYVANGAFDQVDLSLTSNSAYKAALAKARSEKTLPPYSGESVLRGQITGPAIKSQ